MPTSFSYNTQAVLVGGSDPYASEGPSGISFMKRVQSTSVAVNIARTDLFGMAGEGGDTMVGRPTVGLDISYFPTDGVNEGLLGFCTDGVTPSLASLYNDERNYYAVINQGGLDVLGYSGWNNKIMALGNGVVTNYSLNAGVGQVTSVNVSIDCLNVLFQNSGSGQTLPSVNRGDGSSPSGKYTLPFVTDRLSTASGLSGAAITAVGPKDLCLYFDTGSSFGIALSGQTAIPLQTFSFNINLPRTVVKNLGDAYPEARPFQLPITISAEAQGYLTDLQLAALNTFNCPDSGNSISIALRQPCSDNLGVQFSFTNAKLESQTITSQIGQFSRVNLAWSVKIYNFADSCNSSQFFIADNSLFFVSDHLHYVVNYILPLVNTW